MTRAEIRDKYCDTDGYIVCHKCPVAGECSCNFSGYEDCVTEIYHYINSGEVDVKNTETASNADIVNHPPHYNREGAMESIDEMVMVFGKEVVKHFCLCNVWKYRYRAADKNGAEDVKKSDWYMRKYKELDGCVGTEAI